MDTEIGKRGTRPDRTHIDKSPLGTPPIVPGEIRMIPETVTPDQPDPVPVPIPLPKKQEPTKKVIESSPPKK